MKKYFFILVLFSIASCYSFCQEGEESFQRRILLLDSLHRILPGVKDSAKVDCLNALSENSLYFTRDFRPGDFRRSSDSMYKYARLAYEEAIRIHYKYGIANSLVNLYNSYQERRGIPGDSIYEQAVKDSLLIKFGDEALLLAKETGNNELLGTIYSFGHFDRKLSRVENYKRSIDYYRKAGDVKNEFMVMTYLTNEFDYSNEESLAYADSSLQLAGKITPTTFRDHELVQTAFANMGWIFEKAGEYESALSYMHQSDNYSRKYGGPGRPAQLCEVYYLMGKYDSAYRYWQTWREGYNNYYYGFQAFGNTLLGKIYLKTTQLDKAIDMFNVSLKALEINGKYDTLSAWGLVEPLIYLGEAYYRKGDYKNALSYARQGLYFANVIGDKRYLLEGSEIISRIYHRLDNDDSAYNYLLRYTDLKDSIQSKQFLFKLSNYKQKAEDERKKAQILLLNKDSQIKDAQVKQESTVKNFLIGGLIILVVAGIFFYRSTSLKRKTEKLQREQLENNLIVQQLENEKKQAELQQQAAALEMQALRAQMNPHFIFNCLSSINRIILKNETQTASDYLTRFSRLIRMVLINSQKSMITLEDELHMLRLYLDMERLRFKDSFDYRIVFANRIDEGAVHIPPLLLQPFCENAIWHGLMQKDSHGHLTIELSMQEEVLQCVIEDDGIGREAAEALKSKSAEKQKSMGLQITTQRLALLSQGKHLGSFYSIEDRRDDENNISGTRVILRIYYKEMAEQIV